MRGWLFLPVKFFVYACSEKRNILLIFMKKKLQILARGEEEVLFEGKLEENFQIV